MASFWDWVPTLITAGTAIYGANLAQEAREEATQQANQATQQSTQAIVDANREATAANVEAIEAAQEMMKEQQYAASPGLVSVQNIIGRGEELTPVQEQGLTDARRRTLDALQGGSLRGSARATAETVRDVEGRMRDQYIDTNRMRADQAASNLAGQYFNAGRNVADLNLQKGATTSAGLLNTGTAQAGGLNQMGQNLATNTINTAVTQGSAIGDVTALIADKLKEEGTRERNSAYGSTRPRETM